MVFLFCFFVAKDPGGLITNDLQQLILFNHGDGVKTMQPATQVITLYRFTHLPFDPGEQA